MKSVFAAGVMLLALSPAICSAEGNDLAALREAIGGKDHICVAEAKKGGVADVGCQLGSGTNVTDRYFSVPLSWVKAHFEASPGSAGKWISMARGNAPAFESKQDAREWLEKMEAARMEAAGMLLLVKDPIPQKDGSVVVMVEAPPAGASCKVVLRKRDAAAKEGSRWVGVSSAPDCDFHSKR